MNRKTLGDMRRCFPMLNDIRWQGNPLHKDIKNGGIQFCRMIIIALWPHLKNLNGGYITKDERYTAERYFLSLANQKHPCIDTVDPLSKEGSIRKYLHSLHGDILPVSSPLDVTSEDSEFSRSLIQLNLYGDSVQAVTESQIVKKLPNTMKIRDLKALCMRLFGIPTSYQRLLYNNGNMPLSIQFDEEQRDLRFYGVGDGYSIRIQDVREIS